MGEQREGGVGLLRTAGSVHGETELSASSMDHPTTMEESKSTFTKRLGIAATVVSLKGLFLW